MSAVVSTHQLTTIDRANVSGVLRVPEGARTVVTLMHPRQDCTHHAMVPYLLDAGYAVWTQVSRSPNNDLNLLHEQALLDFGAGHRFLRERFDRVFSIGHSGGATLAAFYCEQAGLAPAQRLRDTPSGAPVPLADDELPLPDGVIFLAPHPGQGALLARLIDPSVTDEDDPMSLDPDLDPFNPANGFVPAPESTTYAPDFIERYRAAQAERIARIDARARALADLTTASQQAYADSRDVADRRASLAPRLVPVYRTDADLRNVDLSLDPNERPYGSLYGRPDLGNYGLVGFGRLSTAQAWMSTWSANTTRADFLRNAPGVQVPTLIVEFTGDQASYPSDMIAMEKALGADDLTRTKAAGTHFGGPIRKGAPTGTELAFAEIAPWLADRT